MESGGGFLGVRVDPQRGSAELSGGSATSCGDQTPLGSPSNTALVEVRATEDCASYISEQAARQLCPVVLATGMTGTVTQWRWLVAMTIATAHCANTRGDGQAEFAWVAVCVQ